MLHWKKTLHQLFQKNAIDEYKDITQNIYVFRFILFCIAAYSVEFLLNCAGIFIVDQRIFRNGYVAACIDAAVYVVVLFLVGLEHVLSKYIGITALVCIITAANITLTYHMVIIMMIPIMIAGIYSSKRLSVYTFFITILSITASTYAGYYYGLCDANMALLTTTSLRYLVDEQGRFLMNEVNTNPNMTLALFFVFPRCLMAIAFAIVSSSGNRIIRRSQQKAARDEMTGLYNKNKLLALYEDHTYDNQRLAVIYWDVNQLKYVNDTYGHLAGDQLIIKVAQAIRIAAGEDGIAFRYGGDEFLLIIPDGTKEMVQEILRKFEEAAEAAGNDCEYPVSASVGYAFGEKEWIKNVIAAADKNMYQCKDAVHGRSRKL